MLGALLARFRQLSRQRRQQHQIIRLSQVDQAALAGQAPPDPNRVLVVRNDSIGDYLLFRPWLRRLAQEVRGRGQRLTLAANAVWAPLARAWDADLFDELLVVEFGRFQTDLAYRADVLRRIGAGGYGEVVYALHVREPAVENFIRFLRAPLRVASQGEHCHDAWFRLLDQGYTQLLPAVPKTLFEYDRNAEFFASWQREAQDFHESRHAFTPARTALPPLRIPVAAADAARFRPADGRPLIVLFPGASARQKRWPAAHFARLAHGLHERYGSQYRLALAGSAADNGHAQRILQAAGPAVPLENYCGQTTLPELAALLSQARLLISNDTVAAHLATQLGTACVVVLRGENYGKFFPYPPALHQAPNRCLFPPEMEARFAQGNFSPPARDPDIRRIAPERVLAAAAELL